MCVLKGQWYSNCELLPGIYKMWGLSLSPPPSYLQTDGFLHFLKKWSTNDNFFATKFSRRSWIKRKKMQEVNKIPNFEAQSRSLSKQEVIDLELFRCLDDSVHFLYLKWKHTKLCMCSSMQLSYISFSRNLRNFYF